MNEWSLIFSFDVVLLLSQNFSFIFPDLNWLNLEIIQSCDMNELICIGAISFKESFQNDLTIAAFGNIFDHHVTSLIFPRLVLNINTVEGSDEFVKIVWIWYSNNFFLFSQFWSQKPFEQPGEFIMMLWCMHLEVLNNTNGSWYSKAP